MLHHWLLKLSNKAVQFVKFMHFVERDVELFGGSMLTASWQCYVIF